ncbi:MAG TPA: SIR2 family protein, partial [Verrucomicrobiae bacterium]|nr:SIR2 family protein [Verrucomicrobiae bacterium]
MNSQKRKLLLFLGAGASVDAGLPSAAMVTRHFESFSTHTCSSSAVLVENLFRLVQVEIASQMGVSASSVDYEAVLGALLDAAEGRNLFSTKKLSELVHTHFGQVDLQRLVRDYVLYIRGLFLPIRDVAYLDTLLHTVWEHEGTIATLNYDLCVERRHIELERKVRTGFGPDRLWKGFDTEEPGTELLKLHGSVQWLRQSVTSDDPYSILHFLRFFSEPFTTGLHKTAAWVADENGEGVRLLMNFGISKEQLYITPPFTEIFSRFHANLEEAGIIVIAGYSFRDPAVNRMLLESLKHKRVPVVAINPQIDELMERHACVKALQEYGVLIPSSKSITKISRADVDQWLEVALKPAPASIASPPGFDDRAVVNRVHDLVVELSLLEYYIGDVLQETDAGHPAIYGQLNCLVQSLERCRGTYCQALMATGANIQPESARQVYSRELVNLLSCREALADGLASLQNILRQLEPWQHPFQVISTKVKELDNDGNLRRLLEHILGT